MIQRRVTVSSPETVRHSSTCASAMSFWGGGPASRSPTRCVVRQSGSVKEWAPFNVSQLDVGDGHVLYFEEVGNPAGSPILYLHGGPGSGCTQGARRHFNPERHRAILFDQRAAGRSQPHASEEGVHWASIDLEHHVADIEALRRALAMNAGQYSGSPGDPYSQSRTHSATQPVSQRWSSPR